jgi:antitoxin YefM
MNTITATDARSNLFKLLKQTVKGHLHTKISSKEGNAVLISEDDYESLLETAELLSVPGLKESIKRADKEIEKGAVYDLKDIFG